jgi:hypothetical protein
MAFTGITATEAEIDQQTGANVSASYTDVMKTAALLHAESYLNAFTEYNWSDNWASLNVDTKYIVTMATSSYVAIQAINYDPDAIGRSTAIHKVNVLKDQFNMAIAQLKDQSKRGFVQKV